VAGNMVRRDRSHRLLASRTSRSRIQTSRMQRSIRRVTTGVILTAPDASLWKKKLLRRGCRFDDCEIRRRLANERTNSRHAGDGTAHEPTDGG